MTRRPLVRGLAALLATGLLALAAPLAAEAHVRVAPDTAQPGTYTVLTFRVPDESASASTTRLEVDLPKDTPFGSASYAPVPGWSAKVVTEKLAEPVKTGDATITEAPTRIVWTAKKGHGLAPGQFGRFAITVGPVPETGSITLPARQTYSDGTVVDWDERTPESGSEPEHPAPTLYVTDAPPDTHGAGATVEATPVGTTDTLTPLALGVGIAGLALGGLALVVAVFALTRRRSGTGGG